MRSGILVSHSSLIYVLLRARPQKYYGFFGDRAALCVKSHVSAVRRKKTDKFFGDRDVLSNKSRYLVVRRWKKCYNFGVGSPAHLRTFNSFCVIVIHFSILQQFLLSRHYMSLSMDCPVSRTHTKMSRMVMRHIRVWHWVEWGINDITASYYRFTKFLKIISPTSPLFSGWNCAP